MLLDQLKVLTSRVDQTAKAGQEHNRLMAASHEEMRKASTLLRELVGQLDPLMERHATITRVLTEVERRMAAHVEALRAATRR